VTPEPTLFDDGPTRGTHLLVERAGHAYVAPHQSLAGEWYYTVHCRTCRWTGPQTYGPSSAHYAAGYHDGATHHPNPASRSNGEAA
jgi:hypothetical protein